MIPHVTIGVYTAQSQAVLSLTLTKIIFSSLKAHTNLLALANCVYMYSLHAYREFHEWHLRLHQELICWFAFLDVKDSQLQSQNFTMCSVPQDLFYCTIYICSFESKTLQMLYEFLRSTENQTEPSRNLSWICSWNFLIIHVWTECRLGLSVGLSVGLPEDLYCLSFWGLVIREERSKCWITIVM